MAEPELSNGRKHSHTHTLLKYPPRARASASCKTPLLGQLRLVPRSISAAGMLTRAERMGTSDLTGQT